MSWGSGEGRGVASGDLTQLGPSVGPGAVTMVTLVLEVCVHVWVCVHATDSQVVMLFFHIDVINQIQKCEFATTPPSPYAYLITHTHTHKLSGVQYRETKCVQDGDRRKTVSDRPSSSK